MLLLQAADLLQRSMVPCFAKQLTGMDCPGCGMQRAALAALRGDWAGSWATYPPLGLMATLMLVTALHLIFRFRHGARLVQWIFILTAAAVAVNYGYKLATGRVV